MLAYVQYSYSLLYNFKALWRYYGEDLYLYEEKFRTQLTDLSEAKMRAFVRIWDMTKFEIHKINEKSENNVNKI